MIQFALIWLSLVGCGPGQSTKPNEAALSDMTDLSIWGDGMEGFGASSGGGNADSDTGPMDADADSDTDADMDADTDADTDADADADADADTDAACIDIAGESCFDLISEECGYCVEGGGECYSGWSCADFGMARTEANDNPTLSHDDHSPATTSKGVR